ncbi:MAG TPA: Maf family protein [Terriglobales bacterium]|nr:Maf family protein [Terriglobales bacterium]
MSRLVLASASPRRRELLRHLVADFVVRPSAIDEHLEPGPLTTAVARLAERKGRAVAASLTAGVVLAADTVVAVGGDALGKPRDADEARAMLRRLRGRGHEVVTGVAVLDVAAGAMTSAAEVTEVVMARYGDDLIERYVASGAPFDKAGGYAIQELDGVLVDRLVGSYTNVIGLPLGLTARLLKAAGVALSGSAWA